MNAKLKTKVTTKKKRTDPAPRLWEVCLKEFGRVKLGDDFSEF